METVRFMKDLNQSIFSFDERRFLAIPGNKEHALKFAVEHFLEVGNKAIDDHGFFAVALSGGSTPKTIYQSLSSIENKNRLPWEKVLLFWSDERAVPPTHPDSNFHMAMEEGGLKTLPILNENIFRMVAEHHYEENSLAYEKLIQEKLKNRPFDLIMLGLGDFGHTASLFPDTEAMKIKNRSVVLNYVHQKNSWRMTFTFELINQANHICFYVWGEDKATLVDYVFTSPYNSELIPAQGIGSKEHPALWILDTSASKNLLIKFPPPR